MSTSGASSLREIGLSFLYNCGSLATINVSGLSRLSGIGSGFLWNCRTLTIVDFSGLEQLREVGDRFMSECSSLTSISLPRVSNLSHIGSAFLSGCTSLTSADVSGLLELQCIGDEFMADCPNLALVQMPQISRLSSVGRSFLRGCTHLSPDSSIYLPRQIGDDCMIDCGALETWFVEFRRSMEPELRIFTLWLLAFQVTHWRMEYLLCSAGLQPSAVASWVEVFLIFFMQCPLQISCTFCFSPKDQWAHVASLMCPNSFTQCTDGKRDLAELRRFRTNVTRVFYCIGFYCYLSQCLLWVWMLSLWRCGLQVEFFSALDMAQNFLYAAVAVSYCRYLGSRFLCCAAQILMLRLLLSKFDLAAIYSYASRLVFSGSTMSHLDCRIVQFRQLGPVDGPVWVSHLGPFELCTGLALNLVNGTLFNQGVEVEYFDF